MDTTTDENKSNEIKQEKYILTITKDSVSSTDNRFTMDNLSLGDNYKPLDAYFVKANGEMTRRKRNKNEKKLTNQTLPRIAFQIYEKQISALSKEERETFPVCRYIPGGELYKGIFNSEEEYKMGYKNTWEFLKYENDKTFFIYSWNIFSTIIFVQECLKRFGDDGDKFILIYRDKTKIEEKAEQQTEQTKDVLNAIDESADNIENYRNPYSSILLKSKNIILHGAPGTGKTYLAKEIATDIVSNGYFDEYINLSDEQKEQIEFVQFHPSYDYTDFVEGLRPKINADGTMGFELKDGIFKSFVNRAKINFENYEKSEEDVIKELSVREALFNFLYDVELGVKMFKSVSGSEFSIIGFDDKNINISIPNNSVSNKLNLSISDICKMLESDFKFEKINDITSFFNKKYATQGYSYLFVIYKEIMKIKKSVKKIKYNKEPLKKYIFIIDEINRGEISKIFGELFFAIDPGYRGKEGEVSTQYSNLHSDSEEKLYIPENVYIIGTMNDIDRSVDSFDFAMRRRFRFIEIKADDRLEMLSDLSEELMEEAIKRMTALNKEISAVEGLNENYNIGPSYFLKLKEIDFDKLWSDYLKPLLHDYIQGMYDEKTIMEKFEKAYGYKPERENMNENG